MKKEIDGCYNICDTPIHSNYTSIPTDILNDCYLLYMYSIILVIFNYLLFYHLLFIIKCVSVKNKRPREIY